MVNPSSYPIEERNRKISKLHERRANGHEEPRFPEPKSLLRRSLKYLSILSAAQLKALARKQYQNPDTSL
jgi:hypothetical protein